MSNIQSRKWLITINNHEKLGLEVDVIRDKLSTMSLDYYCFAEEIGKQSGIKHIHIFIY